MKVRPFLIKTKDTIQQAPVLDVRFREIRRATGRTFAGMTEVESAGHDRSKLTIRGSSTSNDFRDPERVTLIRANGNGAQQYGVIVDRVSNSIKKCVRRIRPEDAATIQAIDEEIAVLEAKIIEWRKTRKEEVQQAWKRGTEIMPHELSPEEGQTHRRVTA